jgi:hypothetical protein
MAQKASRVIGWSLLGLSIIGAVAEICTSWNVLSIFLGREFALFLSFAVFHFSVSDNLCIYETLINETERYWQLISSDDLYARPFWFFLYVLSLYASFGLFLPFSYMHTYFQTSLFLYVHFTKYHVIIPHLVSWLIIPAVMTVTINVFNKICSLLTDLCRHCITEHKQMQSLPLYQTIQQSLSWTICAMLTLSFTESVYLSLQYGVAHYRIMHQLSATLGFANEMLLITAISLATFHTMSAVSRHLVACCFEPLHRSYGVLHYVRSHSAFVLSVQAWGYFTVLVRSFVRGLQTTNIGQGFHLVVVNTFDKGRRNPAAYQIFKQYDAEQLPAAKKMPQETKKSDAPDWVSVFYDRIFR